MNISSSLIAKGAAGTLATTTAIGGGGVVANKFGLFDGFWGASAEGNENLQVDQEVTEDRASKDLETVNHRSEDLSSGTRSTEDDSSNSAGVPNANAVGQGNGPNQHEIVDGGRGSGGTELRNSDTGGQASVTGDVDLSDNGRSSGDQADQAANTAITNSGENSSEGKPANDLSETVQVGAQDSDVDSNRGKQKDKTSKWDDALINYLKEEKNKNRDITFFVKTGKNADVNLTNDFPNFEDEEKKSKNTNKQKSIITVTVTTSNANLSGDDSNDEIEKLRKMNGGSGESDGKNWTWECKIIFSKDKDNLNFEDGEKLIGSDGFFNKLVASNNQELKAKFIRNCAKSRDDNKSTKYEKETLDDEKITSEKIFELEKNSDGTKWKVKKERFDNWFLTSSRDN